MSFRPLVRVSCSERCRLPRYAQAEVFNKGWPCPPDTPLGAGLLDLAEGFPRRKYFLVADGFRMSSDQIIKWPCSWTLSHS